MNPLDILDEIAKARNGKINEVGILPDGSGFATTSFPLKKTHWIYNKEEYLEDPPMPFRMGAGDRVSFGFERSKDPKDPNDSGIVHGITMTREGFSNLIREAGKYAVKASTMCGKDMDFDPDAMLQNLVVGMLGYWTDDGLSHLS